jgi:hypothetical protein
MSGVLRRGGSRLLARTVPLAVWLTRTLNGWVERQEQEDRQPVLPREQRTRDALQTCRLALVALLLLMVATQYVPTWGAPAGILLASWLAERPTPQRWLAWLMIVAALLLLERTTR